MVNAVDIMIGIEVVGVVGGCRGRFTECAGAHIEGWMLLEAGGSGESILEGIKCDRVGRTSGFIKTREQASAMMFL